ncbi:MAG: PHP domain-containing protein [Bacteroidales bacterium]|nr:PHP domain-containing protein [Bacteroidales bacterium]
MDAFAEIPGKDELLNGYKQHPERDTLKVNSHLHTPYSFSAFERIEDIFEHAEKEEIKVLGINDFFVTDGYPEFFRLAHQYRIFPLFNIELIGLLEKEQHQQIRVNDPNNPGRTYFCGKGLRYPFALQRKNSEKLQQVRIASQQQVVEMIEKLQAWLSEKKAPFSISYDEVKNALAKELVRERHIAKMLRVKLNESYHQEKERKKFLADLYAGRESKANPMNNAALEEELRGNLLKSGGIAFVPESPEAFLPVHDIIDIIIEAGGIPCYPVLLDDKNGNFTEFESDFQTLQRRLQELNVGMVELIPGRNDVTILKKFVKYFDDAGFVILFGTEHNTPVMIPLTLTTRGNTPLDQELQQISEAGCCLVAAHQYLIAKGYPGYISRDGKINVQEKENFVSLGRAVIDKFIIR